MTNDDAATATIEVGSLTDLPLFVIFLQICKIVVPIGFGFFLLFIEIFVSDDDERFHMFASNGYFF